MQFTLREFKRILQRRFLNLFNDYRKVNGTLRWEKTFTCHDLDMADGLPVLKGTAVVNAMYSI